MVVTGDVTQLDLPKGISGLKQVRNILAGVHNIAFCDFSGKDVVRHSLVAAIVAAYDAAEHKRGPLRTGAAGSPSEKADTGTVHLSTFPSLRTGAAGSPSEKADASRKDGSGGHPD
jgi:hypothetical protein